MWGHMYGGGCLVEGFMMLVWWAAVIWFIVVYDTCRC